MIQLEISEQHQQTYDNARLLAEHMMRPYSRKYDEQEHTYPEEMDEVVKLLEGARATGGSTAKPSGADAGRVVNGGNMGSVIGLQALAWGDLGLFLGMRANGLGIGRAVLDLAEELLQDEGVALDYGMKPSNVSAIKAELYKTEAEWEGARLLTLKAAWMAGSTSSTFPQAGPEVDSPCTLPKQIKKGRHRRN